MHTVPIVDCAVRLGSCNRVEGFENIPLVIVHGLGKPRPAGQKTAVFEPHGEWSFVARSGLSPRFFSERPIDRRDPRVEQIISRFQRSLSRLAFPYKILDYLFMCMHSWN